MITLLAGPVYIELPPKFKMTPHGQTILEVYEDLKKVRLSTFELPGTENIVEGMLKEVLTSEFIPSFKIVKNDEDKFVIHLQLFENGFYYRIIV